LAKKWRPRLETCAARQDRVARERLDERREENARVAMSALRQRVREEFIESIPLRWDYEEDWQRQCLVQQAEKRGITSCQRWSSSELYNALRVWEEETCTREMLEYECRARGIRHADKDESRLLIKRVRAYDDKKNKTQPDCVPRPKRLRREKPNRPPLIIDDDFDSDLSSDTQASP